MLFKKIITFALLFVFICLNAFADPLLLSDAEMQKLAHYFPSQEETHRLWNGNPIAIQLPLNQEKQLIFPSKIEPDLKNALTTDQLRIINNNKVIYLTALKPFPTTRLYVTLQTTGEVILIDLALSDKATTTAVKIDVASNQDSAEPSGTVSHEEPLAENEIPSASSNENAVMLIRFAWKQLFAPKRFLNGLPEVSRAPMHTQPMLSTLIYGDKVYAHPIACWVYDDTYVTAIELRNKYPHSTSIELNHDICGNWQAASLYPRIHLKPAGDKTGDSTVLFLISQKPFGDSMEMCDGHA